MLYIQYLHHCHFLLGNDLNVGFSISHEYARGFVGIRFCAYIISWCEIISHIYPYFGEFVVGAESIVWLSL